MTRRHQRVPISSSAHEVAEILRTFKIQPNYRRGQNFLIDDQVYEDILSTAQLTSHDTVLEIGSGLGTLTARLQPLVQKVVSVEVDARLVALLRQRFFGQDNVVIEESDILSVSVVKFGLNLPYKVVANIPYSITSAIFKKFLTQDVQPTTMTLLVQREVAERITAAPGDMSLLSLSVQLYSMPSIVAFVSKTSFFPPPKVDSALLAIENVHPFPFFDVPEKFFWRVARTGFAARRKQIKNNFMAGFHLSAEVTQQVLASVNIPAQHRAQDLTIEGWHRLAVAMSKLGSVD